MIMKNFVFIENVLTIIIQSGCLGTTKLSFWELTLKLNKEESNTKGDENQVNRLLTYLNPSVGFQGKHAAATPHRNQMRLSCDENDNSSSGLKDHANPTQILYGKCVFFFGSADEDIIHRHLEFF